MAKDTIIEKKSTLQLRGKLYDISTPKTMGILNITPDSFYDGGQYSQDHELLSKAEQHLNEGAFMLDLGAASSRPGAEMLSANQEWDRLAPAMELILKSFPLALLSIDTYHSEVARKAMDFGAALINDISGGQLDPNMFDFIGEYNAPYAMMHMKGNPQTMQSQTNYKDIVGEMIQYFSSRLNDLKKRNVSNILIDPGFGFSKTQEQNYHLLSRLNAFDIFEEPVLIGLSRKSMFYKALNTSASEALNATSIGHTIALQQKQNVILRVHDVKPAMEAIKIVTLAQTS